jgi:hypothetical protein
VTPIEPTDDRFELLDAYLDEELTVAEQRSVDELLASSAEARAELDDIRRVRSLVRGLPEVDAPFGFYERMVRPKRRRARGVAFAAVGAVAAAVVLVIALAPVGDQFTPPVDDVALDHVTLASHTGEVPADLTPMALEEADRMANYEAPPMMANGYERVAVYDAPGGVHLVYENGDQDMVSVYERRGRVDWDGLPDGGTRKQMDDGDAWHAEMTYDRGNEAMVVDIVVLARDGLVVTVVGAAPADDVEAVAMSVPDPPSPSMGDRVGDAARWIAEGFGFPG